MSAPVLPDDRFNRALLGNVRPPDWKNPEPADRYNLVVIGAGTAGLMTAAVGAGLGAKVALVERHLMGGDCLNVGCVPSKAVVRAARARAAVAQGAQFGLEFPAGSTHRFDVVMERMRQLRARISQSDSAKRFSGLGVDVFIGDGHFVGPDMVQVGSAVLHFSRAAICTGARAAAPPIDGLDEAGYLTNETVFSLTALPTRLAVVGAGPIGCELAQAFARFGTEVTLLERIGHILPREDIEASAIVQKQMANEGVTFVFNAVIDKVERRGAEKIVSYTINADRRQLAVDEIFVGVGRAPNIEGLGLEAAGVAHDKTGVTVDRSLRTSNSRIYAAGDICFPFKFTHTADAMAQILVQNALFPHPFGLGTVSTDSLIIPWCTYTEPEIAHVGISSTEVSQGSEVETFTQPFNEIDRAILDGEEAGFVRIHVKQGTDEILGATIVGHDAGNMISEVTLAMKARAGLGVIGRTIHPYPTRAEALRKVANQLRKARFSGRQRALLGRLFTWRR